MRLIRPFVALLALSLTVAACASPTKPAPAPVPLALAGTWTGPLVGLGPGFARLELTQDGTALSGTWAAATLGGNDQGTLKGMVEGGRLTLTLHSALDGACPIALHGTATAADLTGTWASIECSVTVIGGFTLGREPR